MKTLEVKAGSVEEAIEKGLAELNKKREEVEVEIVDNGGFLKKAKVVLKVLPTEGEKALEFLQQLLVKMNIDVTAELKEDAEKAEITVSGKDSGNVIGYRGDVLDAIQYITTVAVNKGQENFKKIVVDCENYRAKRTETLISLAEKLADKAVKRGCKVSLEPMNPYERRIIHSALQNNDQVTTESEGIEPNRYIVIKPKNIKPYNNYREDKPYIKRAYGDRPEGGYNKDSRFGSEGYNKDRREGGYNKEGGYNRDKGREGGYSRDRNSAPRKSSSFNSFGTYLGNSKSGFSSDNDFTKKSGFDNLKD